jgi:integrase
MATITTRKRKNGGAAYLVQILRKRKGEIIHRESRTFDNRRAAVAWGKQRETELDQPGALTALKRPDGTLADAIDRHIKDLGDKIGKTKRQVLLKVRTYPIAEMSFAEIQSSYIVELARQIADNGAQPQTVLNYMAHLQTVFEVARRGYGFEVDPHAMGDALYSLRKSQAVAKSNRRERRPTREEMDKLVGYFAERAERSPHSAPMVEIIVFAMFSTRRMEEITRIRWGDLEQPHDGHLARVLVRDMKNPGQKRGNNVWCDLPPEALAVVNGMPRTSERIFPYTVDAVGAAFTRACRVLGINNEEMPDDHRLHFHDLRHEGISRLFEIGWNIPVVATVSGHRSWDSLKRYAQIRKTGDKWKDWDWRQPRPANVVQLRR